MLLPPFLICVCIFPVDIFLCTCIIYYYAWLCPFVRSCVRVKNGNGSRMRALPDELSPVTSEVHGHRSKYHVFIIIIVREDASSFQRLQDLVSRCHVNTKVSCGIVLYVKAKQRYNCYARLNASMCIKWSRYRSTACGLWKLGYSASLPLWSSSCL